MNLESTAGDRVPFNDPNRMFSGFSMDDVIRMASCAGDFMLAIDDAGIVRDVAVNIRDHGFASQWIGTKWIDTVTVESRPKIEQLLARSAATNGIWRQVNHLDGSDDFPVSYQLIQPANGGWAIAIGRDLRAISALQQRLLKTQQSMERDYLHLRQTETRYRLLFDTIAYPVIICDAESQVIQQANQASCALAAVTPGGLDGKSLLSIVHSDDRDMVIGYLAATAASGTAAPVRVRIAHGEAPLTLSALAFRQAGKQLWLISIEDGSRQSPAPESDSYILDVVEKMPDAFVLTDDKHAIIVVNRAFAELVQAGSAEQLVGKPLNRFVGRPDVDLGLLRKQLRDYQHIRNFSSIINDLNGGTEPVEISAILIEREQPLFGYSLRSVGRRERDLPSTDMQMPRSVDQLADLIGRKTLKEIVRESTDLIERMCIEAALVHTADNRASAAEILGLSRQSLYSKLHRHGLGNLQDRD